MVTVLHRTLNHWFYQSSSYRPEEWVAVTAEGEILQGNFDHYSEQEKFKDKELVITLTKGRVWNEPQWNAQYLAPWNSSIVQRYATFKGVSAEEAIAKAQERRSKEIADEQYIQANPEAHLRRELKGHDWYYCMSDDGGVFMAGHNHWKFIQELAKKVQNSQQIIDEYNPEKKRQQQDQQQ